MNAVFTISKVNNTYTFFCRRYMAYNKYDISDKDIFKTMKELTNTFNNELNIGILFEVE